MRTIQHKGQVLNAFLSFIPPQIFSEKLKPNNVLHRLQRVNDINQAGEFNVEVSVHDDLEFNSLCGTDEVFNGPQDVIKGSSVTYEESSSHKKQFNMLKSRNLELFKFASEKIFNGIPENMRMESIPSLINIEKCLIDMESNSIDIVSPVDMVEGAVDIKEAVKGKKGGKKRKKPSC